MSLLPTRVRLYITAQKFVVSSLDIENCQALPMSPLFRLDQYHCRVRFIV